MDPMPIDPEQDAGLQVAAGDPVATRRYRIEGMHCTGCASELQSALRSRTEVASATVDFTSGLAVVEGDLEVPPTLEVIASRGFKGEFLETKEDLSETRSRMELAQARTVRMWKRRAIIGIGVWIPLETLHWTVGHGVAWVPWIMMLGGLLVLVVAGGGFYASAYTAARRGGTNMDTLISIGATTAFVWSLIVFIAQRTLPDPAAWLPLPLYFAESAALLGIISLGHFLEAKASARASTAVRDLLELQPEVAERVDASGATTEVPSSEIEVGDVYLVRPGGRGHPERQRTPPAVGHRRWSQHHRRADRQHGPERAVEPGPDPTSRGSRVVDLRPDGALGGGGFPLRLGIHHGRLEHRRGQHGDGPDHLLPLRPRPRHPDGGDGRRRRGQSPWNPHQERLES
jgi:copper chaperone CopZ